MPPKPKRLPHPALHHLKNSRQLLEDFLYQYLPQLSSMGSISRINLYIWCNSRWGLSPDAKQGLPYMVLESLRLQRQHLLRQKLSLKPLSLTLMGEKDDKLMEKAQLQLQDISSLSHTAKIAAHLLPWQEQLKQLQAQFLRQPATERSLMILDPLELPLPRLAELLQLLPKKLEVLLVLPSSALQQAAAIPQKTPIAEGFEALVPWLAPHLQPETSATAEDTPAIQDLLQQLRQSLAKTGERFVMHHLMENAASSQTSRDTPAVLLLGLTAEALFMEKMLQARQQLVALSAQHLNAGKQLGLFGARLQEVIPAPSPIAQHILALFAEQPEWNNQELYKALLQREILATEASPELTALLATGKLEMLDEKKKKKPATANPALSHTAFKLPAPSRYFRLKP